MGSDVVRSGRLFGKRGRAVTYTTGFVWKQIKFLKSPKIESNECCEFVS